MPTNHPSSSRATTRTSPLAQFSGESAEAPSWSKVTLGFDSPGGDVHVQFRFTADDSCSALDPFPCGGEYNGAHVDEVVIGAQAR